MWRRLIDKLGAGAVVTFVVAFLVEGWALVEIVQHLQQGQWWVLLFWGVLLLGALAITVVTMIAAFMVWACSYLAFG